VTGIGLALALGLAVGCGSGSPEQASLEGTAEYQGMKNLCAMYRIVSTSMKRPPRSINELRKAEAEVPGGFGGIGESNVAIYFGAELPEVSGKLVEGASETVLAYDRMVPRQGGVALMLDGTVRQLSPEEFRAAKKAGTKPWIAPPGS
jgi:hypothetical protein